MATLKDGWEKFEREMIATDVGNPARRVLRGAFYAGCATAAAIISGGVDAESTLDEATDELRTQDGNGGTT